MRFFPIWGLNSLPFCFNITNATSSLSLCVYVTVFISEAHLEHDALWKEKNENMFKVIFGEKDMTFVRKYMQKVTICPQLWLEQVANGFVHKTNYPLCHDSGKKKTFLHMINKLKTPTNYARSLGTKVQKEGKLWGLKSMITTSSCNKYFPFAYAP